MLSLPGAEVAKMLCILVEGYKNNCEVLYCGQNISIMLGYKENKLKNRFHKFCVFVTFIIICINILGVGTPSLRIQFIRISEIKYLDISWRKLYFGAGNADYLQ